MKRRRVKLGLYDLTVAEIMPFCRAVIEKMTGNVNFPTPNPDLAVVAAAVDELAAANIAAKDGGKTLNATVRLKRNAVFNRMRPLRDYVNEMGNGDEAILRSSGFPLADLPSKVYLVIPGDVRTKTLEGKGNVRVMCDTVDGATGYQVRHRPVQRLLQQANLDVLPEPVNLIDNWHYEDPKGPGSQEITRLLSAVYYEFQMRAIGSGNPSEWSGSSQGLPA